MSLQKIQQEVGFVAGDELTKAQMMQLMTMHLGNEELAQVASIVKNFVPGAKAALEALSANINAAKDIDVAVIGALKQAIVELGSYKDDDSPEVKLAAIKQIRKISKKIYKISKRGHKRSGLNMGVIAVAFIALIQVVTMGRVRLR